MYVLLFVFVSIGTANVRKKSTEGHSHRLTSMSESPKLTAENIQQVGVYSVVDSTKPTNSSELKLTQEPSQGQTPIAIAMLDEPPSEECSLEMKILSLDNGNQGMFLFVTIHVLTKQIIPLVCIYSAFFCVYL